MSTPYTTRTADWVIQKAFLIGEAKSTPPSSGTNKYNVLLGIVDNEQKDWADEPGIQWDSLYQPITLSTLISAAASFPLDVAVGDPSLYVKDSITLRPAVGGSPVYAKLVQPNQLTQYQNDIAAAIEGRNLVFSQAFSASDALIGGTIQVPNYGYVGDITIGSNVIQVDNPLYLAYMCAAAFVLNDIIKAGNYNLHLAKAAELMEKMKQLNGAQFDQVTRDYSVQGQSWV
jgi:hypothetical protein